MEPLRRGAPSRKQLAANGNPIAEQPISSNMSLDVKELTKPIRKLRKSLKKASRKPSPDQVHDIRTQSRRLEASIAAFRLDQEPIGRRVLEAITPIRKKAGTVRDMDVLTEFAAGLPKEARDECFFRLLTHLGARRVRSARKLYKTITKYGTQARDSLKKYRSLIRTHCKTSKEGSLEGKEWERNAIATALEISTELADWPKLDAANLHAFRLQAKQLGYVLKLAGNSDSAYLDALGKTKDAIGEWHDWIDLNATAEKVIAHRGDCPLRREIDSIAAQKLAAALSVASRLRRNFLETAERRKGRAPQHVKLKEPVLITAARLA